jgi:hypothetical protein
MNIDLNTRLHLPSDGFMALDLFEDGYETPYKDFAVFGERIGLSSKKANKLLESSALSKQAIDKYMEYVLDRAKMFL